MSSYNSLIKRNNPIGKQAKKLNRHYIKENKRMTKNT